MKMPVQFEDFWSWDEIGSESGKSSKSSATMKKGFFDCSNITWNNEKDIELDD